MSIWLALVRLEIKANQMIKENSTSSGKSVTDYVCKDVHVECADYDFKSEMAARIQENMGGS